MIECKNIKKSYSNGLGETMILGGVSFSISDGEFVAIIGPSGSGKSTIMNILGALDTPTGGEYILDGKNISAYKDDELAELRNKKIGFVFQSFNLLPRSTVMRNVTLPLIYSECPKDDRERIGKAALKSAGLDEKYHYHLSNQLSGGQMQRVAIARALVNNPSLILADEPTGNLDTKTGDIVLATFEELNRRENRTIILITHEKDVAEHANRIISIRDGLIVDDYKVRK